MGTLIDARYFLARIGTKDERRKDRHFAYRLCKMETDFQYHQAKEKGDTALLEVLDQRYTLLEAL